MKKLLVCLCAGFLLAGCGGGSSEPVSKTCSQELMPGAVIEMAMSGEGDVVNKAEMKVTMTFESLNLDKAKVTEEQKKQISDMMKETILKEMEMEEADGYTVDSTFDDNGLLITIGAEANVFEQTFNATKFDDMVKELEGDGFTCK